MLLRCPKCKSEFVQFLREPQTTNECRKCGAKIPLDALARFEFTCPACKKVSYGRTNIEDAENKAAYQKMKQEYDGSVRNPYCRRWTHRAIVRSFKKKFR